MSRAYQPPLLVFVVLVLLIIGGCLPVHAKGSPVQTPRARKTVLICLDAGHGGKNIGIRVGAVQEKKLTLALTRRVEKKLKRLGYRVVLTRTRDLNVSLNRRTQIANSIKATLFISIHFNAHSSSAQGIEVFHYSRGNRHRKLQSKRLAEAIFQNLIARTHANPRGVKHGNFHVIRETQMPSILLEGGFVTHPGERMKLQQDSYMESLAMGIVDGVERYLGCLYRLQ